MCSIVEVTFRYLADRPQVHSDISGLPFMVMRFVLDVSVNLRFLGIWIRFVLWHASGNFRTLDEAVFGLFLIAACVASRHAPSRLLQLFEGVER